MSYVPGENGIGLHRLSWTVWCFVELYRAVKRCVGQYSVEYACISLDMAV